MKENRLLPLKATLNVVNMVVHHFYDVTTASRVYRGWFKRQRRLRVPNKTAGERARQAPPALKDLLFDGAIGKNGLKASRKNHAALRRTISQHSFRCDVFIFFCCSPF